MLSNVVAATVKIHGLLFLSYKTLYVHHVLLLTSSNNATKTKLVGFYPHFSHFNHIFTVSTLTSSLLLHDAFFLSQLLTLVILYHLFIMYTGLWPVAINVI